jgi:uncharacterized protein
VKVSGTSAVRRSLGRWFPTRESLRASRGLRWLGPLLDRPWLWQMNRRGVAAGAGIGVFFGLLVPVLQIPLAAVFALLLRANLPIAAAGTLVSNPLTYAPIFVAAYRVGATLLGDVPDDGQAAVIEDEVEHAEMLAPGWWQRFAAVAKPMMLGLALFATLGGLAAYAAAMLAWHLAVLIRMRRRKRRLAERRTS